MTQYTISATAAIEAATVVGAASHHLDRPAAQPSRQSSGIRRDAIASTNPMPMTSSDPLSQPSTAARYHGVAWPSGIQLAIGRSESAAMPIPAAAAANARMSG